MGRSTGSGIEPDRTGDAGAPSVARNSVFPIAGAADTRDGSTSSQQGSLSCPQADRVSAAHRHRQPATWQAGAIAVCKFSCRFVCNRPTLFLFTASNCAVLTLHRLSHRPASVLRPRHKKRRLPPTRCIIDAQPRAAELRAKRRERFSAAQSWLIWPRLKALVIGVVDDRTT
jgi:hypothetical protein